MKVLLIGGTKFIGRAAVSDLAARGYEVVVMNRGTRPDHPDAARTIICDKNDRDRFAQVLKAEAWDAVIDTILDDEDLKFVIEQLGGQIRQLIHTGSIGVYGACTPVPACESDPLIEHDKVYNFNHKLRQDQVLLRAHREHGFPGTSLRMSYIYGPGSVLLEGWGGRAPEFFHLLRDGQAVLLPGDGRALLHPGYVTDLASAFGNALESPETIGQIYNIGGPRAVMMRDYIARIAAELEVEPKIEYVDPEKILKQFPALVDRRGLYFACEHMCCDISKAHREMGWRPTTPLGKGLEKSIHWMREEGHV